jgi:hypothetical protein
MHEIDATSRQFLVGEYGIPPTVIAERNYRSPAPPVNGDTVNSDDDWE